MKFALNGALTIGTLDGANIEIRDHVGADNIFIFGLTAAEVAVRRLDGWHPEFSIVASPALAGAIEAIGRGTFSPGEDARFAPIVDELRRIDRFLVTADFDSYAEAQRRVAALWRDRDAWWRAAVLNTAGMGPFSSDRAIGEYAEKIWHVTGLER
jgi:starch phosphorylase